MRKFNSYNHSRDMVSKMYAVLCVTSESTRSVSGAIDREFLKLYVAARAEMDNPASFHAPRTWKTSAADAFRIASTITRAADRGIMFAWMNDNDFEPGDTPDNASQLNRCAFEHGGRHIVSRSAESAIAGGYAHLHGELFRTCDYSSAERYDVSGCIAYLPCERHEDWPDCDPHNCSDGCEVIASLWGIQESRDHMERDHYRRDVESALASEALAILDDRACDSVALETFRARGIEYIGRGV